MTSTLDSFKAKKYEHLGREEFVQKTHEALDKMKDQIEEATDLAATDEEKKDVVDKITEVKNWFTDMVH